MHHIKGKAIFILQRQKMTSRNAYSNLLIRSMNFVTNYSKILTVAAVHFPLTRLLCFSFCCYSSLSWNKRLLTGMHFLRAALSVCSSPDEHCSNNLYRYRGFVAPLTQAVRWLCHLPLTQLLRKRNNRWETDSW